MICVDGIVGFVVGCGFGGCWGGDWCGWCGGDDVEVVVIYGEVGGVEIFFVGVDVLVLGV